MKWIKNHKLISFLLAAVLLGLLILAGSAATGGRGNAVTRLVNTVYTAVEKPISSVASGISDQISGIFSYKELQKENEALQRENQELKEQIAGLSLSANELKELKRLSQVLNYKGIGGSNDIVSADVVSMDGTNWMNLFTINAGTEEGIREGSVVVSGEGLVGRVHSAGKGWAKVVSLIDESSRITFKVSDDLKLIGVVEGSSDGTMSGFMLDSRAKVSEGDRLETSGMGVFPAGIEIGKITKVRYDSDEQLQKISVKSSVDFKSLQKVTVIL